MPASFHFPNYSVGRIYASDEHGAFLYKSDAQGAVNLEHNTAARLRLAPQIEDLSWIQNLPPDGVEELICHAARFDGSQLKYIAHLHKLRRLQLSFCKITDRDLSELSTLVDLKHLQLNWTAVSDAGLNHLQNLQSLKTLDLSRTQISDKGLEAISKLQKLAHLSLWDCKITGCTLTQFANLPTLTHLWLSRTRLQDSFGQGLGLLTHLQSLEIAETQAADGTIESLKATPLETLDISQTKVGDSSVKIICSMESLRKLGAMETLITSEGAEMIRKQRPNLEFNYSERSLQPTLAQTRQKALGL